MMPNWKLDRVRLGALGAVAAAASLAALLPGGAMQVQAQSYQPAPQASADTTTTASGPAVDAPVQSQANAVGSTSAALPASPDQTALAAPAAANSADIAAPAPDDATLPAPAPGQMRAPAAPRGPMSIQGPNKNGAKGGPPGRFSGPPRGRRYGRFARPAYHPGPAARPVPTLARVPAAAPRLPNAGTGGLLNQDSGSAVGEWGMVALLLGALALGGTGILAYRRQR